MPPIVDNHIQAWVCGAIAFLALLVYGLGDVFRLSAKRIWAISSVCFAESYRRKVLLITPLAIIGVIVVAQLQRPIDEQDAIRQTLKFCLFATGMLVTVTAIILAATNLPKEIDNRVIYTVVTKPTTRLEIILGKILGFARVSAMILIVMGLFTLGYAGFRSWRFERGIADRLSAPPTEIDEVSRPTLKHYFDAGLLTAKDLVNTTDLQIYSRVPDPSSSRRYTYGNGESDIVIPFEVKPIDLSPPGLDPVTPGAGGLGISLRIGAERIPGMPDQPEARAEAKPRAALPPTVAAPATQSATKPAVASAIAAPTSSPASANIMLQIFDANQNVLVVSQDISTKPIQIADMTGGDPTQIFIPSRAAQAIYKPGVDVNAPMLIYIQIDGTSPNYEYFLDSDPMRLIVPPVQGSQPTVLLPAKDKTAPAETSPAVFRGREGTAGQQIRGGAVGSIPVAIYRFSDAKPRTNGQDVTFEFKTGIEKNGDEDASVDDTTRMTAEVFDRDSGQKSPPVHVALESIRQTYFTIPAQYLGNGNFDVRIWCNSNQQYLGLFPNSLGMVAASESFTLNLLKSLLIMWLMAILVIAVAICCSTFLSWPIAVVLTLVILLGHWGIEQLGDSTLPGIGPQIVNDMGFSDPNQAKVVSTSVEALSHGLRLLSNVLPDLSQFAATDDIEEGLAVPSSRLTDALVVLGTYGLATMALAYVFLKQKEVAP